MRLMFARALTVALAVLGGAAAMAFPKLIVVEAIPEAASAHDRRTVADRRDGDSHLAHPIVRRPPGDAPPCCADAAPRHCHSCPCRRHRHLGGATASGCTGRRRIRPLPLPPRRRRRLRPPPRPPPHRSPRRARRRPPPRSRLPTPTPTPTPTPAPSSDSAPPHRRRPSSRPPRRAGAHPRRRRRREGPRRPRRRGRSATSRSRRARTTATGRPFPPASRLNRAVEDASSPRSRPRTRTTRTRTTASSLAGERRTTGRTRARSAAATARMCEHARRASLASHQSNRPRAHCAFISGAGCRRRSAGR